VDVNRKALFASETLQIGLFEAHPESDACGDVEQQSANVVVLPVSGVFSKHDAPGRYVLGTPSYAVFVAADTPYRVGYPGAIGDRALNSAIWCGSGTRAARRAPQSRDPGAARIAAGQRHDAAQSFLRSPRTG
jgi:hypothetical protein